MFNSLLSKLNYDTFLKDEKVKLYLGLINLAPRHYDVWGCRSIAPPFLISPFTLRATLNP
jgi:hypothetical protein